MNRLASESSPYLRQHRDNPVDWWPWCDEAFAQARDRDVPVLLSVGYSACHWCHVMAHESFEDAEVAEVMNRLFVNVKVDREERPDVDSVYMDAVQAMTGRGGWPMTVFLTPDARPFFGGTYYPKPTFLQLMNAVDDAWRNRRDDINGNVQALVENIGRTSQIRQSGDKASIDAFRAAVAQYDSTFDSQWGGFGGAPKFPGTMALELLLRAYLNDESPRTREMITTTLDAMASGGMYDHLGGGFARYSVDEKWLVPHFEKMLYDQALLLRPYLHASLVWRDERYRQVVHETIEYVLRELRSPEGGFYSAQDADSLDEAGHSHEGHFYVFTPDQVRRIVPAHLVELALDWYEITDAGNFEGKSIPCRLARRGQLLRNDDVETIRSLLFAARTTRPHPGLDDKVITEWNALMIASLAEAAAAFGNDAWALAAQRAGDFLATTMRRTDGRYLRTWHRDAPGKHLAMAADLANAIDAYVRLYELSGLARFVALARDAAQRIVELDAAWPRNAKHLARIVRALEVLELTGEPYAASFPRIGPARWDTAIVGIDWASDVLDERLEVRTDAMFEAGLSEEVSALLARGLRDGVTASRALGYAQVIDALDAGGGAAHLREARDRTLAGTRRYVRRQRSWFRRDHRIRWLDGSGPGLLDAALAHWRHVSSGS